jgi:hypothetical protein
MKDRTISFLDQTPVFYYGFKSLMEGTVCTVNFLNEKDFRKPELEPVPVGDYVCYHILPEYGIKQIRENCHKIKMIQPGVKIVSCFSFLNCNSLKLIEQSRFNGYIMTGDGAAEILEVFEMVSNGEAGMSKGFFKNYIRLKHRENNPEFKKENRKPRTSKWWETKMT